MAALAVGVGASLNNLGPGLGDVALNYKAVSDPAKWLLIMAMLLGRLEIFTLLVLIPAMFSAFAGNTLIQSSEWIPALGLEFAFRFDGLSMLFSLMILVIGLLVILYVCEFHRPGRAAWADPSQHALL